MVLVSETLLDDGLVAEHLIIFVSRAARYDQLGSAVLHSISQLGCTEPSENHTVHSSHSSTRQHRHHTLNPCAHVYYHSISFLNSLLSQNAAQSQHHPMQFVITHTTILSCHTLEVYCHLLTSMSIHAILTYIQFPIRKPITSMTILFIIYSTLFYPFYLLRLFSPKTSSLTY